MEGNARGAGDRRCYVTFESNQGVRDSMGGVTDQWATVTAAWVAIQLLREREVFYHHELGAEVTHIVTMKTDPLVKATHRINFGGRYFKITSIKNVDERNNDSLVFCAELDAGTR